MEEDKYNDLKSPDKMDDYRKAIEYLNMAEMHMSKALSGKNRRGMLTDISNVAYRIKSEYLND
jgi:hypothetical protein